MFHQGLEVRVSERAEPATDACDSSIPWTIVDCVVRKMYYCVKHGVESIFCCKRRIECRYCIARYIFGLCDLPYKVPVVHSTLL